MVVLIGPGQPAGQFVRRYRAAGLALVFPNAASPAISLSKRFQGDFRRFDKSASAPTREKLMTALESMKEVDIGIISNDCKLVF